MDIFTPSAYTGSNDFLTCAIWLSENSRETANRTPPLPWDRSFLSVLKPGGITSLVWIVCFSQVSLAMTVSCVHASTASQNTWQGCFVSLPRGC